MYLTNCSPRTLIGAFSVTTEVAMKDQQTLRPLHNFFAACLKPDLLAITAF
uniref:Uncharacterized protein n=1 Tax=Methylophaga nitratireducenticrescens TaxID=754476 RepID=I1XEZ4_METNJ